MLKEVKNKKKNSIFIDVILAVTIIVLTSIFIYLFSYSFFRVGLSKPNDFLDNGLYVWLLEFVILLSIGLSMLILGTRLILLIKKSVIKLTLVRIFLLFVCVSFIVFNFINRKPVYVYILKGFEQRVKNETDIVGMKAWLKSMGRNRSHRYFIEEEFWPEAIKDMSPDTVCLEHLNNKIITRLGWGGSLVGHWGLVVGPEDIEVKNGDITKAISNAKTVVQKEVEPGAYIWYTSD